MLEAITGFLGSALSGGITGVLGAGIIALFSWLNKKQDYAQQIALREMDLKQVQLEADNAVRLEKERRETEEIRADSLAFSDSQRYWNSELPEAYASKMPKWVVALLGLAEFAKGAIRPVLTVYLLGACTWVTFVAFNATGGGVIRHNAFTLAMQCVDTINYLTVTAITWWFGSRGIKTK